MKSIRDFAAEGKRVLVRCDFNVPLDEEGCIADDFRIQATLPTIEYLLEKGAKIILMSHLGDPAGKVEERLKMDRVQEKLTEYLDLSVTKARDCVGKKIQAYTLAMKQGEILLLENLRFHKEEELNDAGFARELALLGDIFLNDAFGVSHRNHASVAKIPQYLPAGMGLLMEKEIQTLKKLQEHPEQPMIVIVGGVKVQTKLSFIDRVSDIADRVLLSNVLSNEVLRQRIQFKNPGKIVMSLDGVPGQGKDFDIGPKTRKLFQEQIWRARTIFWTGPLGRVEEKQYAQGSLMIAHAIIQSNAFKGAGGGDLDAFLGRYNLRDQFDYVSTGGGATLAFLAGEKLPGLESLEIKNEN